MNTFRKPYIPGKCRLWNIYLKRCDHVFFLSIPQSNIYISSLLANYLILNPRAAPERNYICIDNRIDKFGIISDPTNRNLGNYFIVNMGHDTTN